MVDLSAENAQRTCDGISAEGGEARAATSDVSATAACEATVSAALERHGALHVLLNNATDHGKGTMKNLNEENFEFNVPVN